MALTRYPFADIERLVSRRTGLPLHSEGCPCHRGGGCVSAAFLANYFGTSERQVRRWRRAGGLTEIAADRIAVDLGMMISDIWD